MLKRAILLCTAFCLATMLAGCVAVKFTSDGKPSMSLVWPGSKELTAPPPPSGSVVVSQSPTNHDSGRSGPAMPGKELTSGPWNVQVESTDAPKSLPDGARPHGGKHFLLVNVSIRNVGYSAALVVRPSQFRLVAAGGSAVKPYSTRLAAFNARDVRPVDVGMGRFTQFVYELPAGASGYTFVVTPQQGATGSMSWIVP
jgi:hypothetical protein